MKDSKNKDFLNACENVRKRFIKSGEAYNLKEIISAAILEEADSFYITPKVCNKIILAFEQGKIKTKNELKKDLHRKIVSIYKKEIMENPGKDKFKIIERIISMPAPRFYISERTGLSIYYKTLKQ